MVKPGSHDVAGNLQQTVISKLKKVFVEASSQGNAKLQETVVLTIGQLGRIAEGDLLLVVVVSLLESLTAPSQLIRAIAFEQVSTRMLIEPVIWGLGVGGWVFFRLY